VNRPAAEPYYLPRAALKMLRGLFRALHQQANRHYGDYSEYDRSRLESAGALQLSGRLAAERGRIFARWRLSEFQTAVPLPSHRAL
jgi:uncharacterized SAM-binding protein YcdF (DUF218 family)